MNSRRKQISQSEFLNGILTHVHGSIVEIDTTQLKCKMQVTFSPAGAEAQPWEDVRMHDWRSREMRVNNSLWLDIVAWSEHPALKAIFAVPSRTTLVYNTKDSLYFEIDGGNTSVHVSLTEVQLKELDFRDEVDCDIVALISAAGGYRNLHSCPFAMFE